MRIAAEHARVMVTVKTSPQPSEKYGDTVCVAGIRVDQGRAEWIRLYPIAFRWLDRDSQFKKYDVIDVEIRRRDQDSRPESYSPSKDSIHFVEHLKGWKERQRILEHVPRTSTCELRASAQGKHDAPSLGMVGVRSLTGVWFDEHPGWTEAEKRKIAASFDQTRASLFGSDHLPPVLEAPLFKFGYRYRCMADGCPGHRGQLLDWELTELERRLRSEGPGQIKEKIEAKFRTMMFATKRETSFFMGNFEDPKKRDKFSVLGVHYPERVIAESAVLF